MRSVATSEEVNAAVDAPPASAALAQVAAGLLGQPSLGIVRVHVIGLPEREAVHFAIAGTARGLRCETIRGSHGELRVALRRPDLPAAAPPHARDERSVGGAPRRWLQSVSRRVRAAVWARHS